MRKPCTRRVKVSLGCLGLLALWHYFVTKQIIYLLHTRVWTNSVGFSPREKELASPSEEHECKHSRPASAWRVRCFSLARKRWRAGQAGVTLHTRENHFHLQGSNLSERNAPLFPERPSEEGPRENKNCDQDSSKEENNLKVGRGKML